MGQRRRRRTFGRATRCDGRRCRRLRFEPLEDRRLLAVFTVSNLADAGAGSLRAAITAANGAAGADAIDFSVTGTINIMSALPQITGAVTIDGPGAELLTIDAGGGATPAPGDGWRILLINDNTAVNQSVLIRGLTFTGGDLGSGSGGAIVNNENLTIDDCVFVGNRAGADGGAIYSFNSNSTGTSLTINRSTFTQNTAPARGGAMTVAVGGIEINNSTISGNTADTRGGAIYSFPDAAGSNNTIRHSTITGNMGGTIGGAIFTFGAHVISSIIAANAAPNHPNVFGPLATDEFNFIDGNPMLASLTHNGGSTPTHLPLAGSPVINAGDLNAVASAGGVPLTDQRGLGFDRIVGRIDIGAVEVQELVVDTLVDESNGDYGPGDLSLREAIELANAAGAVKTIRFASQLTAGSQATILLTQGELPVSNSLIVIGPGADRLTIDASGNDPTPAANEGNGSRVFNINDGNGTADKEVLISGLTLTGGDVDSSGGGIANGEILTLREIVIAGNAATLHGGAVNNTGVLVVERSTLSSNFAALGGAVTNAGQTTIRDSTISGNSATVRGGGVYNFAGGDLTIARSTMTDNSAGQLGGGLSTQGNVSVSSSIIAGNDAPSLENVFGTLDSSSNNILSGDPLLGPLADNGGPTSTHAVLLGSPALDAALTPLYQYPLNENFEDALGLGGDLAPLGGALTGEAYKFGANQGLQTQISATEAAEYSLELWFKLENVSASSGYQKLIDFSTPAHPNAGLYVFNNRLRYVVDTVTGFYTGTQFLTANTLHHVVLTRSGGPTVEITTYVDGVFDKSYPESFGGHTLAVFSEAGGGGDARVVRLFRSQNGFGPPGAGTVDRIRFYGDALGAAEVTEAFATVSLPDFDQRGAPFARQAGAKIDIGAYELQSAPAADFNSDGNRDGADFLAWQRGLGKPNAVHADGDSDGDADVDAADLAVWTQQFGEGVTPDLDWINSPPSEPTLAASAEPALAASVILSLDPAPAASLRPTVAARSAYRPLPSAGIARDAVLAQWFPLASTDVDASSAEVDDLSATGDEGQRHAEDSWLDWDEFADAAL
jgi:predicted outer membrane repeat protein